MTILVLKLVQNMYVRCDQLWYRSSVKKCSRDAYSNCCPSIVSSVVTGVKSVGSIE